MKEKTGKHLSWIKDKIVLFGSISSIIVFIGIIINVLKEVIDRMTPIGINSILAVFFLGLSIALFYLWVYQRSEKYRKIDEDERRDLKLEYEEARDALKKELGEKIKKCNEQYKQLKLELEDSIKHHNALIAHQESNLDKRVQLMDCDIKLHYKEGNPKLTITQNLINMSYDKLVLKSLFLFVKADGAEIDKIVYDSENATSDLGKKIFVSDLSPFNKDCWITCETTRLPRINPNYHEEKVKIGVDGEICFYVQSGKVTKKIKETKEFEIVATEILKTK